MAFLDSGTLNMISGLSIDNEIEDPSKDDVQQIMVSKDDKIFIWSKKHQNILVISSSSKKYKEVITLTLTDTPIFEVEFLCLSSGSRWICLSGPRGVTAVEIPRKYGSPEITVRAVPIAERFFLCQRKLIVQQAAWHPGSLNESHLVVLASDNYIRVYNLDSDNQTPERSITLTKSGTNFFGRSGLSVKASLGETAIGFSFAPPVENGENDEEWPIFVLQGNGNVYCLVANISNPKTPVKVLLPIPLYKDEGNDDYGEEFCSILCLHPAISSPPIIVIATSRGCLYHCIVLTTERDENVDEVASQISEWSSSALNTEAEIYLSLHVFESIELELGLTTVSEKYKHPLKYPLLLHSDPISPSRYFVTHGAGVHCVVVPMMTQLVKMAMCKDSKVPESTPECIVEHLICTRMSPSCPPAPILGLSLVYPPTILIVLLNNYNLEFRSLRSPLFDPPSPLLQSATTTTTLSPLKKPDKEPFDQYMKKLLIQKNSNHPLIKSAENTDLSPKECLEVLSRSTQVFREEYLIRIELVRNETDRRVAALLKLKSNQAAMIVRLEENRKILRDNAANIAERYEDIKDNGDRLTERIEIVLQKIQRRLPVNSDAEIRMQRELTEIEKKMKDLKFIMDQVKAKEKYQQRQVINAKQQEQSWRSNRHSFGTEACVVGENQIDSIKEILQQDSLQISELLKQVNSAKRDLIL